MSLSHIPLWTDGFEVTAALTVCPAVGLEGPGVFPAELAHGQGSVKLSAEGISQLHTS